MVVDVGMVVVVGYEKAGVDRLPNRSGFRQLNEEPEGSGFRIWMEAGFFWNLRVWWVRSM